MEWTWLPDGLFLRGLIIGLGLTLMIGPITLSILRYGMMVHPVSGYWVAVGTWISDIVFIAATYLLTQPIMDELAIPGIKDTVFIGGGIGLCVIAFLLFKQKRIISEMNDQKISSGVLNGILAGLAVNSFSPFTFFFWLTSSVWLHSQHLDGWYYFSGVMISIMAGDTLKAVYAPKLASLLGSRTSVLIRLSTSIMIGFMGALAIYKGITQTI